MRLTFDSSVPRLDQLMRYAACKQPGRKHNHKPSNRAVQRKKNQAKAAAKVLEKEKAGFHAEVRAYWRGERDTNPAHR